MDGRYGYVRESWNTGMQYRHHENVEDLTLCFETAQFVPL